MCISTKTASCVANSPVCVSWSVNEWNSCSGYQHACHSSCTSGFPDRNSWTQNAVISQPSPPRAVIKQYHSVIISKGIYWFLYLGRFTFLSRFFSPKNVLYKILKIFGTVYLMSGSFKTFSSVIRISLSLEWSSICSLQSELWSIMQSKFHQAADYFQFRPSN